MFRDHRPDFKTLKCVVCGKQFRFIGADEYAGKIKENKHDRNS